MADLSVDVRIEDRHARVTVDQVIVNGSAQRVTAINLWPAPPGIRVTSFQYTIDGRVSPAREVSGAEADAIYREAAQRTNDPRILGYLGRPFFRGPETTIPGGGRVRMQMAFEAELAESDGIVRFHHPFDTNSFSRLPINRARMQVRLTTTEPLAFYYSPSHPIAWSRSGDHTVEGSYAEAGTRPDRDLLVYFGTGKSDVDLRILGDRRTGFGGAFLASIRPGPGLPASRPVPRDLVFVLDRSGSMAGPKIEQARAGLEFSLSRLNPGDRFSVVTFASDETAWRTELVPATPANIEAAREAIRRITAAGGTNIHDALQRGLQILGPGERPAAVLFLTDGLPTNGITGLDAIRTAVQKANTRRARIFVFGVGYDVNVPFLDRLATDNRGDGEFVRPGDDLEQRMASFYAKQAQPLLTDLRLAIDGVDAVDVLPGELPDLFAGGEVLVVGRYRKPGTATLRLTGRSDGKSRTFTASFPLPAGPGPYEFVPRLWAQRKIGDLLDRVRLQGEDPALLEQIAALSREFGILTDVTRGLVDASVSLEAPRQLEAVKSNLGRANSVQKGAYATSQSVNNRALRQQGQVYANSYLDEAGKPIEAGGARQANGRAQFFRGGYWTDPDWPADAKPLRVKRFSPAYWEISRAVPTANAALAAGRQVRLLIRGKPVEVGDDGVSELSARDRAALFGPGSPGVGGSGQRKGGTRSAAPFAICCLLGIASGCWAARRRPG